MAKVAQKITLSPSRDIPFDKLVLSQSNVRRIKAGVSVEELAEDIARRGLLQGLNVRPVLDADGVETGTFEIPAGGRRFQALSLLVKQKRLAKTAPIPCIVRDAASEILAEDDSLAENMQRVALHPLDQFRAFQALREKGQGEEGDRGGLLRHAADREAAPETRLRGPCPARGLCRGWHDAGTADGLHGEPGSCASGAGLGRGEELLEQGALRHPAHADRDLGPGLGSSRGLRGRRCL